MPEAYNDMPNMTAKEAREFDASRLRNSVAQSAIGIFAMHERKGFLHIPNRAGDGKCRSLEDYCDVCEIPVTTAYRWITQVRTSLHANSWTLSQLMEQAEPKLLTNSVVQILAKLPEPAQQAAAFSEAEALRRSAETVGELPPGQYEANLRVTVNRLKPKKEEETSTKRSHGGNDSGSIPKIPDTSTRVEFLKEITNQIDAAIEQNGKPGPWFKLGEPVTHWADLPPAPQEHIAETLPEDTTATILSCIKWHIEQLGGLAAFARHCGYTNGGSLSLQMSGKRPFADQVLTAIGYKRIGEDEYEPLPCVQVEAEPKQEVPSMEPLIEALAAGTVIFGKNSKHQADRVCVYKKSLWIWVDSLGVIIDVPITMLQEAGL